MILLVLLLLLVLYFLFYPVTIEPVAFNAPANPGLKGDFEVNQNQWKFNCS